MLWTDYIFKYPKRNFKVAIKREDGLQFFSIHAKNFSEDDKNKVVVLNNITESYNYQKNLELEIKKEVEIIHKKDEIMIAQSRQAAMGDMISMIAHQWRQPITAISMGAQNMQLDIELEDVDFKRFDKKLTKIVQQTGFLSKTIDDFRNFMKPKSKLDKCMLCEIFDGTINIMGKSLENNNIMLERTFENDIEIITYRNELIQVLLNIIGNAKDIIVIKKISNGLIHVDMKYDEENIYIKICDNAGGVPKDIISNIFEPYFTTKEEKGGTGLGLYISKMIVEKHLKGRLTVQNNENGACFNIVLKMLSNDDE